MLSNSEHEIQIISESHMSLITMSTDPTKQQIIAKVIACNMTPIQF